MKKFLHIFIAVAAVSFFAACDDNDKNDGEPASLVVNVSNVEELEDASEVEYVQAVLYYYDNSRANDRVSNRGSRAAGTRSTRAYGYEIIAESSYRNRSFSVELPAPLADKYLTPVTSMYSDDDYSISNKSARIASVEFEGYTGISTDEDSEYVEDFYYGYTTESADCYAWYVYSDSSCTITYSENEEDGWKYTLSINLRPGWNLVYDYDNEDNKTYGETTSRPSWASMKWLFGYDYEW